MNRCESHEIKSAPLRAVTAAFSLTSAIFVFELLGGWWTGSLALMADAAHVGIDLIGLAMAMFAAFMSSRPPDPRRTFGYKRVEVLAALGNGVALWVATGIILREAYARFVFPTPIAAGQMLAIALVGLACNLASGLILLKHSRSNINVRGAFFHVLSDAVGSLGAIGAALFILKTRKYQADAVASCFICFIIVLASYFILRDAVHILLEGAPAHIDIEEIRAALGELPGVTEVHDLHLWSLTEGSESMSGHIVVEKGSDHGDVLKAGRALLKEKFGLSHVTLQIEK